MEKVLLGNTCKYLSKLGLGTMYFGTKVSESVSFQLLDRYVESGGNFIDSANKYASWIPGFNGGESEELVGKWLKERKNRSELIISSKVGFPYGEVPRSLRKELIVSECERSLKRLGVDCIDMYFAHSYDADTPIEETMEAFHKLKTQGKIGYLAASNFPAWRLAQANMVAQANNWTPFEALQQRHTFLEPSLRSSFGNQLLITSEIEDYCKEANITLMGYSPLLGGAYTSPDKVLPTQYEIRSSDIRLKTLRAMADQLSVTANELVLAWMLNSIPQVLPMVAASSIDQLNENLQAVHIKLSTEQMEQLNSEVNLSHNFKF